MLPLIPIPYGELELPFAFPSEVEVEVLLPSGLEEVGEQAIFGALRDPLGSPSLSELAKGARRIVVLVPGKDRRASVDLCLSGVLEVLSAAGVPDSVVSVIVATGTHARHTDKEMAAILGPEAARRLRFRQHDCRPGDHLRGLGQTSRGTDLEFEAEAVEADLRILVGQVLPHYFAGFGGGRKALLPGVASTRTILQNHRLVLDPARGIHPGIRTGALEGNPVHEDMLEAAKSVGPSFVLNTLTSGTGGVVAAVAGGLEEAHEAGCTLARRYYFPPAQAQYDAVITSPGGWPLDCDFVQSLKALFHVREVVRPGGAVLWVADCRQGMKEGFRRWAAFQDEDELEHRVRSQYDLAAHNSLILRAFTRNARVGLVSTLPAEEVRCLGLEAFESLEQGLAWLSPWLRGGARCAVLPCGNLTVPRLEAP